MMSIRAESDNIRHFDTIRNLFRIYTMISRLFYANAISIYIDKPIITSYIRCMNMEKMIEGKYDSVIMKNAEFKNLIA